MLQQIDRWYSEGGDRTAAATTLFDQEWAQVRHGHDWCADQIGRRDWAPHLCLSFALAAPSILSWRLAPRERIEWLKPGLEATRLTGNLEAEAGLWAAIGDAWKRTGEWKSALEAYRQGRARHQQLGDKASEGRTLGNIGVVYLLLGDRGEARYSLEKALAIAREVGDRPAEGRQLGSLGLASEGNEALGHFERALEIAREVGDRPGEISHLGCLGTHWIMNGRAAKADADRTFAHPNIVMRNLRPDGSLPEELVERLARQDSRACLRTAMEYLEQGLSLAHEIGERPAEARITEELGTALAELGDTDRAIEHHERAAAMYREVGDLESEARQLRTLKRAYTESDDREAVQGVEQRLREIDRERSLMKKDDLIAIYGARESPDPFGGEYRRVSTEETAKEYWSLYYATHIGE